MGAPACHIDKGQVFHAERTRFYRPVFPNSQDFCSPVAKVHEVVSEDRIPGCGLGPGRSKGYLCATGLLSWCKLKVQSLWGTGWIPNSAAAALPSSEGCTQFWLSQKRLPRRARSKLPAQWAHSEKRGQEDREGCAGAGKSGDR